MNKPYSFEIFGALMWQWIRGQEYFFHDESSEDIMPLALKAGLVERVKYDPAAHGENIEAEPGDEIWRFVAPTLLQWKHAPDDPACKCAYPRIWQAFPFECQSCMKLLPLEPPCQTPQDAPQNPPTPKPQPKP